MDETKETVKKYWVHGAAVIFLVLFMIMFVLYVRKEHYTEPYYLDMMAMKNPDPMKFKYLGWERDVSGMSGRDYYLENQTNAYNLAAPYYFEGSQAFIDHTDYLDMPKQYRPSPHGSMTAPVMTSEKKSDVEEVKAKEHLSNVGAY